jgi:hypothetical protein
VTIRKLREDAELSQCTADFQHYGASQQGRLQATIYLARPSRGGDAKPPAQALTTGPTFDLRGFTATIGSQAGDGNLCLDSSNNRTPATKWGS